VGSSKNPSFAFNDLVGDLGESEQVTPKPEPKPRPERKAAKPSKTEAAEVTGPPATADVELSKARKKLIDDQLNLDTELVWLKVEVPYGLRAAAKEVAKAKKVTLNEFVENALFEKVDQLSRGDDRRTASSLAAEEH